MRQNGEKRLYADVRGIPGEIEVVSKGFLHHQRTRKAFKAPKWRTPK